MKNSKVKNVIVVVLFVIIIAVPSIIYWIDGDALTKELSKEKQIITEKITEVWENAFEYNK